MVLRSPLKYFFLLLFLVILNWGQAPLVSFLNDDLQIIGTTRPETVAEVFSPISSVNIWGVYWRPMLKILYNTELFLFGHQPAVFRTTGLLLFFIAVCLFYLISHKITNNKRTAFLAAALFCVLPSRELPALWISDQSELLVFIFLSLTLLSALRYFESGLLKDAGITGAFFFLALLSKELAFAAVLIPLIGFMYPQEKRIHVKRTIQLFAVFGAIMSGYFIYRLTVIGSNPFASEHMANVSIPEIFKNFLLYIPSVYINPDMMEILYFSVTGSPILLLLLPALFIFFILLMFKKREHIRKEKKAILFGGFWFILFLLPVLPVYMRWYVFVSSAGLLLVTAVIINTLLDGLQEKILKTAGAVVILLFSLYNFTVASDWVHAGRTMERIGRNIFENKEHLAGNKIVLWGVPDKLNRVAVMKLGQKEIFEFYSGVTGIAVDSPVRLELIGEAPEVLLESANSSKFVLRAIGGRFMSEGGRSRAVLIGEELRFSVNGAEVNIETLVQRKYPVSALTVNGINVTESPETLHLYFNGTDFVRIKSKTAGM